MRGRLGLLVGFGAGYYLGAKAGRQRYEQLNGMIAKVRRTAPVDTAADKAKAVVDLGMERAKDLAESTTGNGGATSGGLASPPEQPVGGTTPLDQGTAYEQSSFTGTYTPTSAGQPRSTGNPPNPTPPIT